jgi:hypothetical protein
MTMFVVLWALHFFSWLVWLFVFNLYFSSSFRIFVQFLLPIRFCGSSDETNYLLNELILSRLWFFLLSITKSMNFYVLPDFTAVLC